MKARSPENDGGGSVSTMMIKEKKLAFLRPPVGPTELPTSGYVPKTNDLSCRWVTVVGGDTEFIKKSFARDMLGSAEASKFQADSFLVLFF